MAVCKNVVLVNFGWDDPVSTGGSTTGSGGSGGK